MKKELTLAEKLFKKVSKKEKAKIKLEKRKAEIEAMASEDELLAEYIDVLSKITEQANLVKSDLDELRDLMAEEGKNLIEDRAVKVTLSNSYTKTVINPKLFYEYYKPTSKVYQKVVEEKDVRGSIKVIDK